MNYASEYGSSGPYQPEKLQAIESQSNPSMKTMFANSNNRSEIWDDDLLRIANADWLKEHLGNEFLT